MDGTFGGLALGLVVGLRHAFEPDHLTAVSTLVADGADGRRGAVLGALWGVGHTLALVIVGVILLGLGAAIPARLGAAFELGVAVMLIGLGIRAIAIAVRTGDEGPHAPHFHGDRSHTHGARHAHVHLGDRAIALRPLAIGVVHGLAGSGALTALVFAELPDTATRVGYLAVFGVGSIVGMTAASGLAGAALARAAGGDRVRRGIELAVGVISVGVGIAWGVPMIAALAG